MNKYQYIRKHKLNGKKADITNEIVGIMNINEYLLATVPKMTKLIDEIHDALTDESLTDQGMVYKIKRNSSGTAGAQPDSDTMKNLPAPAVVQQRLVRPELRFKSATNEWPTPDSLWKPLDDEFGFTLDVCSTHENAKCANHFTLAEDGLKQPWSGVAWMNPPYGAQLARWVKKCHDEAKRGVLVVGLIPVRSNTSYWHDYVMGNEIRFVRGYPKFGNAKQGLKAPLAVVVWRPNAKVSGVPPQD